MLSRLFSCRFSFLSYGAVFLAVAIAPALADCDCTDLDSFRNEGRYYSIYGFLKDGDANHAIRVIPIRRSQERITTTHDPQASIDAIVTTTDTLTGEVVICNHLLTRLEDGSFAHIFRASFNVKTNHAYRLDILRNDGITTSAETTVPTVSSSQIVPGPLVADADSSMFQNIFLSDIHSPWKIEVFYYFSVKGFSRIAYGRSGNTIEGEGWTFTIDYDRDMEQLAALRGTTIDELAWSAMGVKTFVLDKAWDPPQDIFDPEIPAQPGTLSNVENGYGYFGSIGLLQDDWPNSEAFNDAFGFND